MRHFSWTEVSGEKDCLQCAALGERTILERELKLLQGNDASVRFRCPSPGCGFVAVGMVSVDGSEPETAPRPSARPSARPSEKPRYNLSALADPLGDLPGEEVYVEPKTDAEAIARAFGEIVAADEFVRIVEGAYDDEVVSGDWRAVRRITPTRLKMGEEETMDVLVEFLHGEEVVYSCNHSSTSGVPDFQKAKEALRESCRFAIVGPRGGAAVPAPRNQPRGPVAVVSGGWGGNASVADSPADGADALVRQSLMRTFRGA